MAYGSIREKLWNVSTGENGLVGFPSPVLRLKQQNTFIESVMSFMKILFVNKLAGAWKWPKWL